MGLRASGAAAAAAAHTRIAELINKIKELEQQIQRGKDFADPDNQPGGVNAEYLKNCVLRYMGTIDLSEKERLLGVISALLHFSPEEVHNIRRKQQEEKGGVLGWASSSVKNFYGL
mmetsp:Transcript_2707/g.3967  ORF Transcript_2707/g.3967 Transcript_2707/m.3967 type:complete len:116 (+) Transcript_2707:1-348(+)